MGFTLSDHRQPGWNVARPTIVFPTVEISSFPFGNSLTSSLPTALLPPATDLPPSWVRRERLTGAQGCSRRPDDVQRTAHQHEVVGRGHGEGPGQSLWHRPRRVGLEA